ncbi:hypothetical protein D9M69_490640 [compost metagenome]
MHQIRYVVRLDRIENHACRVDVIADELLPVGTTDLGLQHDNDRCVFEMFEPFAGGCDIDALDMDIGLRLFEHVDVGAVLVQHHDVRVAQITQTGYEVLSDQAGSARKDDLVVQVLHACLSQFWLVCILICPRADVA